MCCQPAWNEAASISVWFPGYGWAENTSETTQGAKAIYVHEQKRVQKQQYSYTKPLNQAL